MSKIICEICGTVYPDNATMCPICGYPRNVGDSPEAAEAEASANRGSDRVKGGRFSNSNVKKRNQAPIQEDAPKSRRASKADPDEQPKPKKKKKKSSDNRGLVITVIVLLIAVICVGAYIGIRFFRGADAYKEASQATEPSTEATETVSADTSVACTDIQINDIDLTEGVEFLGMGRAWRMNVTLVPENTTDEITYTSSDENVAVVSLNEDRVEILSVGPGTATITINCGAVTKSFPVACNFDLPTEETSEPTEDTREEGALILDQTEVTLTAEGAAVTLSAGKGVDNTDAKWSSDDEDVATVDENGVVTAVGEGTAEITVELDGEEQTCTVTCDFSGDSETDATGETEATEETKADGGAPYTISHTDVSIVVGESFTLTLRDKNGDVVDVTWEGDEDVKIDGNTITGAGTGRTYVTCTHNGETFECIVRIG